MSVSRSARTDNWIVSLPPPVRQELMKCGRPRRYEPGEPVYGVAESRDLLHLIQEGSAYWSIARKNGQSLLLRIAREGDVFGEVALTDNTSTPVAITARSELTTLAIPHEDFHRIGRSAPIVYEELSAALARRMRGTLRIVEEVALLSLPERARARLGRIARELEPDLCGVSAVRLDITQNELSMMLAASRPATNKALSGLEQDGEISIHFKGVDVHPALLEALRNQ